MLLKFVITEGICRSTGNLGRACGLCVAQFGNNCCGY